ncbi:MAG TPA: betaine/proline/choline family ABC transporter ATP-binding protein [Candidatus Acidoferrum sp.]|nr:betaine/proline/choline family ABC transporter ATP-binding protein [Candidatus Acidoferrum sp.]
MDEAKHTLPAAENPAAPESAVSYTLEAEHVTKIFGHNKAAAARMMEAGAAKDEVHAKTGAAVALWDVSFQVKKGEIFVIIGLSGSGKSTIIRCFNQLIAPTSGHVRYEGADIDGMDKRQLTDLRRNKVAMVFQHFGLFTHRTVMENVAYGLEVRGMQKAQREAKAMELIEMVGLKGWESMPISNLSGGMKQRVGIARALTNDPEVLLMDEPFSALDPLVRRDMQFELLSIQRKLNKTILFITHDINEAFKLGDTVAIMKDGKVIQIDTPDRMSMAPADDYVRQFIESADKSQVLKVRHIMVTPSCMVKEKDDPATAIREMHQNGVSSAFVVDAKMRLLGVLHLNEALRALSEKIPIAPLIERDPVTSGPDAGVSDIMPLAVRTKYPIAVVDEAGVLLGIVSRAAVIASLI